MTQKTEVANQLCRINNWKKIVPMPGACDPPEGVNLASFPDPNWTSMSWTKEQLVYLLASRFADDVFSQFSQEHINALSDGNNPTLVIRKFESLEDEQRRMTAPGRNFIPKKESSKEQLVELLASHFGDAVSSQFSQEHINEISDGDNPTTLVIRKFKRLEEEQRRMTAPEGTAAP